MPRKKTATLTDGELRLMNIIWDKEEATVNDVLAALPRTGTPAYNTVLTILRILEQKGYLRHGKSGRAHVYRPSVNRNQARHRAITHIVKGFFDNSPELLVQNVLSSETISHEELERLKKMIEDSERW
jgi:predicted transcriptional regulator